jgi:pimeloyl-ACP methyl ester carboxylesterase
VVAQAPVAALAEGAFAGLGGGAVEALVDGTPGQVPDRYAVADPIALLPTGVPVVCLHAEGDDVVPIAQSEDYVAAAEAAGDDATLVVVPGGHFEHLDPQSAAIEALRAALRERLRQPG